VNALLGRPLGRSDLLHACLDAEAAVAGRHLDNVAPSLLGGLVLVRANEPPDVVSLPVPAELRVVIAEPEWQLRTAEARAALPRDVPRELAVHQMAQVAALVAAMAQSDFALLGRALDDRLAEPARAPLLPGFAQAKRAALEAGALGASISGAGPSAFAFVRGEAEGRRVAAAMEDAYRAAGIGCRAWVADVDRRGAWVAQPS
jgi:homoserine kinase